MSTRSRIALKTGPNECLAIYVHFDGYVDHHGPILLNHYATRERVEALLALGDLSGLGAELGDKQDFDDRSTQRDNWCLAYGRDRGETGIDARIMPVDDLTTGMIAYGYLFDPATGAWSVKQNGREFVPLAGHPELPAPEAVGAACV